jgi:hypothetical protein
MLTLHLLTAKLCFVYDVILVSSSMLGLLKEVLIKNLSHVHSPYVKGRGIIILFNWDEI